MTLPPGAVHVRRAGPADVEKAAELFDAYRQFYRAPSDVDRARRFLSQRLERGESVLLLATGGTREGRPASDSESLAVGFAHLYPSFSSLQLAGIVILNDLFVAPEWRARGIGGLLLDAALEQARTIGAARLELATQHENAVAQRLYASKGFVADQRFAHLGIDLAPEHTGGHPPP